MPKTIVVPAGELFNPQTNEFIPVKKTTLLLEHSLVAISKWESEWEIPFFSKTPKTNEQVMHYIKCMTLTKNVDPHVYDILTNENLQEIKAYIDKKQTATTISKHAKSNSREIVTSELIYYSMITQNIPKEFEKWPINRLLTLIDVCAIKNAPPKKRGFKQTQDYYDAINKARRAKFGSKG